MVRSNQSGITLRAVAIGLLMVMIIGVWATYVELHARSSRLTMGHFPIAVFALLGNDGWLCGGCEPLFGC